MSEREKQIIWNLKKQKAEIVLRFTGYNSNVYAPKSEKTLKDFKQDSEIMLCI